MATEGPVIDPKDDSNRAGSSAGSGAKTKKVSSTTSKNPFLPMKKSLSALGTSMEELVTLQGQDNFAVAVGRLQGRIESLGDLATTVEIASGATISSLHGEVRVLRQELTAARRELKELSEKHSRDGVETAHLMKQALTEVASGGGRKRQDPLTIEGSGARKKRPSYNPSCGRPPKAPSQSAQVKNWVSWAHAQMKRWEWQDQKGEPRDQLPEIPEHVKVNPRWRRQSPNPLVHQVVGDPGQFDQTVIDSALAETDADAEVVVEPTEEATAES